jgi:glycosyltransferase involved in cell wall biosynthesis
MVSIIIPCYNNGKYLVKMIDCFRRQTSSDWELIIVDDGSTDNTTKKVEAAISDLPNAHLYFRERNPKGSVVCRNIGFEHAKGKYVCHLDADDLVSDTFVEHRVAFMEAHPKLDYATFVAKSFTDEDSLPTYDTPGFVWGEAKGDKPLLYYFLTVNYPFSVWNNIYKTESIRNLLWDEKVLMFTDFSFIVPGIMAGLKHKFCEDKVIDYFYRHDTGNKVAMTSNPVSPEKCSSTLYLLEKTQEGLKKHGLSGEYNEAYFKFFMFHFKNLVLRRTEEALPPFFDLISKYYSKSKLLRMKVIAWLSLSMRNDRLHTFNYYFFGSLLFGRRDYLRTLKKLIIKK